MNADQANDSYTIVIFRGPTAKPLRLSCPRHVVRKALIIGMVLLLADLAVISHYVIRTNEVWELQSVRTDLLNTPQRTSQFPCAAIPAKKWPPFPLPSKVFKTGFSPSRK